MSRDAYIKKISRAKTGKILIRTTNWVGDAVMTLPALEAVKEHFPESSITVLAKPWVVPLFAGHPDVDDIIVFNKKKGLSNSIGEYIRVIKKIRKQNFDLAILFQNAFEAALLTWLGKCRIRAGYNTDGRAFLLTHSIQRSDRVLKLHQVEYYLELLRSMGMEARSRNPKIHVKPQYFEKAEGLLKEHGIESGTFLVGLGPGAMYGNAKRWPPERFATIADFAREHWKAHVVTLGSANEREICERICKLTVNEVYNFCGTTSLEEAVGIISLCGIFVTNDSGLMHISAALGIPTLAIFGSTDHIATGPIGEKASIIKHDFECAPCLKPECPIDHRCMMSIDPEEVWEEMNRMKEQAI